LIIHGTVRCHAQQDAAVVQARLIARELQGTAVLREFRLFPAEQRLNEARFFGPPALALFLPKPSEILPKLAAFDARDNLGRPVLHNSLLSRYFTP
jgi:hypothetical protein